jgi:phage terminase large subunit GpA-like protein
MLYCGDKCPCLNTGCDLYRQCDACVARHHASTKYPLTACEICAKEGCTTADPVQYFKSIRNTERRTK